MADKTTPSRVEKSDPTVKSGTTAPEYPEGTHPLHPLSEQTFAAVNVEYKDMPDDQKPDPSTVANIELRPEERSDS